MIGVTRIWPIGLNFHTNIFNKWCYIHLYKYCWQINKSLYLLHLLSICILSYVQLWRNLPYVYITRYIPAANMFSLSLSLCSIISIDLWWMSFEMFCSQSHCSPPVVDDLYNKLTQYSIDVKTRCIHNAHT